MDDDVLEVLTSIEKETGLGPANIMEILLNMVRGKCKAGEYNYEPYEAFSAAYNLFSIGALTKEQFLEITRLYTPKPFS